MSDFALCFSSPRRPLPSATLHAQQKAPGPETRGTDQKADGYRFKSGVELINVTATVTDVRGPVRVRPSAGRFPRLRRRAACRRIPYFSADRVPVSLGLVLDTSGSMAGEKIDEARQALDRFVFDLLDERDEVFLYRFSDHPVLVQDWTTDRASLSRAMARIVPNGGTALYDAVLEAIPRVAGGHNPKKALVVITDGNDTTSRASLHAVRESLRDSEVLLYAVGIDGRETETLRQLPPRPRGTHRDAPGISLPADASAGRPLPAAAADFWSRRRRTQLAIGSRRRARQRDHPARHDR